MTIQTDREFVVITETNYYGPSVKHAIRRNDDDSQTPIFCSLDDALAAVPDQSGPTHLGHNEASVDTSVWEVETTIDPQDWCAWPKELTEAAIEVLADAGIDAEDADAVSQAEFDYIAEAAQKTGRCVVMTDRGDCLLCKPLATG